MVSPKELRTADLEGFDNLAELALDLSWSWNHATDQIWRTLDATLWELTQNPWAIMQTVSRERLQEALADTAFCEQLHALQRSRCDMNEAPGWFQQTAPLEPLNGVAYFSMEFMLSEALPIYSGGLGNVAGDHLKAASDLGVPVMGVGLLYQQGYFRQIIDPQGQQQALYPYNDPGQLPITPLRTPDGEWLRLEIVLPGYSVWLRAWQARVGSVNLYLLDSNDAANYPAHRGITSELYGGGTELRLKQELLLGIGGWRLLEALGLEPDVCHLNEGHAALAVLERARSYMQKSGDTFDVALAITRAGNLFTTHTAVAAGFDLFAPALIEQYLGHYVVQQLGITVQELLALGRQDPDDSAEPFNMAYLACRGSGAVNGVSRLHARVSRHIFQPLFPRWSTPEIPVGHVTNGVHMPSWDSAAADKLWTQACGKARWLGSTEELTSTIRQVSDDHLWQFRMAASQALVSDTRQRLSRQMAASGAPPETVESVAHLFDPHILTLGFARRFAAYKRPNLLLHDPDRLLRLLTHRDRPLQLIIAGKAHPADQGGQALIQDWIRFIQRPEARPHVVFLADYDMRLTERLVQGVDVWLNTPRRPWEACGTSGMKVLVNGGLNLSELDGWWAEAYSPDVGWALGDGREHDDDSAQDASEAEALYELLEHEVIPAFYARDEFGIPGAWVARMRESMARLTPQFSTNRSLREYTEQYYCPAARAYHRRTANSGALGKRIVAWHSHLDQHWPSLRIEAVSFETRGEWHHFEARIPLGGLGRGEIRAELYADGGREGTLFCQTMSCIEMPAGAAEVAIYRTAVPATRAAEDFTVRLRPNLEEGGAGDVLEIKAGDVLEIEEVRILWQR